MKKKIVLPLVACGLFAGSVTYASIFGEESIILGKQLVKLYAISTNTYKTFTEVREGVDLALEARDEAYQAKALVEELHSYTTDRFITDFKRDVLKTYPDLSVVISDSGSKGLADWTAANMRTPMGSYELIGKVFGEISEDVQSASREGRANVDSTTLYRYEGAAALTASDAANQFIQKSDEDIEVLARQLDGATKEEAIVLQAKMDSVIAAQNSHLIRMRSLELRRQGMLDAMKYKRSAESIDFALKMETDQKEVAQSLNAKPSMMEFSSDWMDL